VQGACSTSDLISIAFFSTRFSTDLLKTFTRHLHLIQFLFRIGSEIALRFLLLAVAFQVSTSTPLNSFLGLANRDEPAFAA